VCCLSLRVVTNFSNISSLQSQFIQLDVAMHAYHATFAILTSKFRPKPSFATWSKYRNKAAQMFKFSQCRILATIHLHHLLYRLHFTKQYFVSSLLSPKGRAELLGKPQSSRFSGHSLNNKNNNNNKYSVFHYFRLRFLCTVFSSSSTCTGQLWP
jgi:hypothetical protein